MRPSFLYLSLLIVAGAQALDVSYAVCRAACLGGPCAMQIFCGSTTPIFAATSLAWFTPVCYGAATALDHAASQEGCLRLCNSLLP